MNKIIDALKLTENTLEDIIRVYKFQTGTPVTTLAAIREALAEQEKQEPVGDFAYTTIKEYEELVGFSVNESFKSGWKMARTTNSMLGIKSAKNKPVMQEPVAIVVEVDRHGDATVVSGAWQLDGGTHTFYAAPVSTKREWVELTVSDLDAIIEKHYDDEMDLKAMILDGIAAFKEKNK